MIPLSTLWRQALGRVGMGHVPDAPEHVRSYADFDRLSLPSVVGDVSLEGFAAAVLDQGATNSCVTNAILDSELTTLRARYGLRNVELGSRLLPYWLGRRFDGWQKRDAGVRPAQVLAALFTYGVCPESVWPFAITKVNTQPPLSALWDARGRRGVRGYYRIFDGGEGRIRAIRAALGSQRALAFATTVSTAFTRSDGASFVQFDAGAPVIGRHMLQVVGLWYQRGQHWIRAKNSWGSGWRDGGYAWLSEEYILNGTDWVVVDPEEPAR